MNSFETMVKKQEEIETLNKKIKEINFLIEEISRTFSKLLNCEDEYLKERQIGTIENFLAETQRIIKS